MARKKADDIRTMRLLIDNFGADVALEHKPVLPRDKRERVSMQMAVEDAAIDWHTSQHLCTLNTGIPRYADHDPLMPRWASLDLPRESRVAVVGPAPSHMDGLKGEVGYAKPDRLLGQQLRSAGIDDSQITWLYCVWCWPDGGSQGAPSTRGSSRGRLLRMPRPPSSGELTAWHPFLKAALDAADVNYVLLHGLQAVNAWRPDLGMGQVVGSQYMWDNRWFVTPLHHATALKHLKETSAARDWELGIEQFAYRVENGVTFGEFPMRCTFCRDRYYACDDDGVAVCEKCLGDNFGKAAAARAKSQKIINQHYEGGML